MSGHLPGSRGEQGRARLWDSRSPVDTYVQPCSGSLCLHRLAEGEELHMLGKPVGELGWGQELEMGCGIFHLRLLSLGLPDLI